MKYQSGAIGRVFIVRFEDGDDLVGGLEEIASREGIGAAAFQLVGGMKRGRFVAGPEKEGMPPQPVWREFDDSHEFLGFGTIFRQGDQPSVHLHGAFGKKDAVRVGCLRGASEAFLVVEAVIQEIVGVTAAREPDTVSGLSLLKI